MANSVMLRNFDSLLSAICHLLYTICYLRFFPRRFTMYLSVFLFNRVL